MLTVATILVLLTAGGAVYLAVQWFRGLAAEDLGDAALEREAANLARAWRVLLVSGVRRLALLGLPVFALLCLGGSEGGSGTRAAIAFALGAMAAASSAWFTGQCAAAAVVRAAKAARSSSGQAPALLFRASTAAATAAGGLCLFGIAGLLLVYQDPEDNFVRQVLAFAAGAAAVALLARTLLRQEPPPSTGLLATAAGRFASEATAVVAAAWIGFTSGADVEHRVRLVILPPVLAAAGMLAAYCAVTRWPGDASRLPALLFRGRTAAAAILALAMAVLTPLIGPEPLLHNGGSAGSGEVWLAALVGLALGLAVPRITEYYTSDRMAPVQELAEQSRGGGHDNVACGLRIGMASTWLPAVLVAIAIWTCYHLAGGYGIGVAAVAMLAPVATLAADAWPLMAQQTAGFAQAAGLDANARAQLQALPTTAATITAHTTGFAITSSVLATLALLACYAASVPVAMDLGNGDVLAGLVLGTLLPFLCAAASVQGMRRAAILVSATPLLTGMILGRAAVAGLLAASLSTGLLLALFLAHTGGAWRDARKYVEAGHLGGSDSDPHRATQLGERVGAPFRDLAPALPALGEWMALVSLLALPLFK